MLTAKELMHLEDFLSMEQCCGNLMNHFASSMQDTQGKQLLQQIGQKSQQNFQTMKKHLGAGQTLQ
ncbi:hypothetical protein [Acetonema longum]|uniref:Spore coat protein n=1 Tax=Acetonema longum DSM 6540 TaxID=1009370 RepID=F7NJE0_9FIRM|nr:hypothetical protein [Acetonema longum]EGO63888.1 hypothetical protein ALO_10979 [Acetonema longum DSM 6540]